MRSDAQEGSAGTSELRVVHVNRVNLHLRAAVRSAAQRAPDLIVTHVSSRDAAQRALRSARGPTVALVDLRVCERWPDGVEIAKALMQQPASVPIALCTSDAAPVHAARAWNVGIRAYLTDQRLVQQHRLIALLWSVWDGDVVYHVDPRADTSLTVLSNREIEILQQKLDGTPHREIAHDLCLSVRTIDSHLANARRKLAAHSVGHTLQIALELGLIRPTGHRPADEGTGSPYAPHR